MRKVDTMVAVSRTANRFPVLISSHPRSGTHLLIDFIRRHFPSTRINKRPLSTLDNLYLNVERTTSDIRPFSPDHCMRIVGAASNCLIKTHYLADFSETWAENETGPIRNDIEAMLQEAKLIYIVRNPVSVMNSYREFLASGDQAPADISLPEFARMQHWNGRDTHMDWWARHVSGWMARSGVLTLKFEDIINEPDRIIAAIAAHTGMRPKPVSPRLPHQTRAIWKGRLDRLLPGHPQSTAVNAKTTAPQASSTARAATAAAMSPAARDLANRLGYVFGSVRIK